MLSFDQLLRADPVDPRAIADYFDALSHEARLGEIRRMDARRQARLYAACAGAFPLDVRFFVPDSVAPLKEVIHYGKNSLPFFTLFEKRFCRPDGGEPGLLWGYNEQRLRHLTGPGYFVVREVPEDRRVVIDYTEVPPRGPKGWPKVMSNSRGLSRFIYAGMRDYMWKVSSHVSIGRAFRNERPTNNTFVLCRADQYE